MCWRGGAFARAQFPKLSLFGVYDGHGGDTVAHYAAKHFPRFLLDTKQLTLDMKDEEVVDRARRGFELALMAIDKEMSQLAEIESGHDQSGSTSVMTLISRSHIVCANTGDSRAVLARGGEAVALSHDHKPFNAGEKERIENAGSHVQFNRVNGVEPHCRTAVLAAVAMAYRASGASPGQAHDLTPELRRPKRLPRLAPCVDSQATWPCRARWVTSCTSAATQ